MGQEKYKEAENIFTEILFLNPSYKDVENLKQIAYIEPFYMQAIAAHTEERYAKAYYLLDNVVAKDPEYKDTKSIRKECLILGTYTIAIVGIDNVSGNNVAGHKIQATLLTALTNSNNPFIKIIDRENMESILEQQRFNLSGAIDVHTMPDGHDENFPTLYAQYRVTNRFGCNAAHQCFRAVATNWER